MRRRYRKLRGDLAELIWGTREIRGRGRTLDGILWIEGTPGPNPSRRAMSTLTSLDTTRRWILHVAGGVECSGVPPRIGEHPRYRKLQQELDERKPGLASLEVGLCEALEEAGEDGEQKRRVAHVYAEKILDLERKICPDEFVRWVMGEVLLIASPSTLRDRQYEELHNSEQEDVEDRDFIADGSDQPVEVQIHPRPEPGTPRIFLDLDELRRRHPEAAAQLGAGSSLPFEVVHHHGSSVTDPSPDECGKES